MKLHVLFRFSCGTSEHGQLGYDVENIDGDSCAQDSFRMVMLPEAPAPDVHVIQVAAGSEVSHFVTLRGE